MRHATQRPPATSTLSKFGSKPSSLCASLKPTTTDARRSERCGSLLEAAGLSDDHPGAAALLTLNAMDVAVTVEP